MTTTTQPDPSAAPRPRVRLVPSGTRLTVRLETGRADEALVESLSRWVWGEIKLRRQTLEPKRRFIGARFRAGVPPRPIYAAA